VAVSFGELGSLIVDRDYQKAKLRLMMIDAISAGVSLRERAELEQRILASRVRENARAHARITAFFRHTHVKMSAIPWL